MGFGGLFQSASSAVDAGGQMQLAKLQDNLNTFGGMMQQQEANQQADALHQEANYAYQDGLYKAQQAYIQGMHAYGQQAETFASNGVELQGSPLATLHETQALTNLQVSLFEQQGSLEQQLYNQQANQTQMQGLTAYLGALGQNLTNDQSTQLSIAQQENQINNEKPNGVVGFGGGLLSALIAH